MPVTPSKRFRNFRSISFITASTETISSVTPDLSGSWMSTFERINVSQFCSGRRGTETPLGKQLRRSSSPASPRQKKIISVPSGGSSAIQRCGAR